MGKNCQQLIEFDRTVTQLEEEIKYARIHLEEQEYSCPVTKASVPQEKEIEPCPTDDLCVTRKQRKGRATPNDSFSYTGEHPDVRVDDWLPTEPSC